MVNPSGGRTSKLKGAPDYDDPTYWDAKFITGRDVGEWLNRGDAVLEAVLTDLQGRYSGAKGASPPALHLGPGISQLGTKLQEAFTRQEWLGHGIVNVDFSAEAVRLGLEGEREKNASQAMQWIRADLRSWDDVAGLSRFAPFDIILDKSTSDAIATSEPQTFAPSDNPAGVCPIVREIVEHNGETAFSPVEVLALHLVPLTQAGTTWFALSYSTVRFDNMRYIGRYWKVVSRTPFKAPAGPVASSTYVPEIFHWLYVLRRV